MQRFGFRKVWWAAAAVVMAGGLAAVQAGGGPAVQVNGGGVGLFIDPSVTPTDQGLTTNFAVGAAIYGDGSANGHFTCLIPGIVEIVGKYTAGSYDAMSGVATLSGTAIIYFPTFDPIPVNFTNTFLEGGPGVGVFTLSEDSGYFPNYPTDVDTEVVVSGKINIH
jgi:hypothetical protein